MSEEHWLPVVGYEGRYEVSDMGRVLSLPRTSERGQSIGGIVLKPISRRSNGHQTVALHRGGSAHITSISVIVLTAFVGPRPPGQHACHRDDIQSNNQLSNLRWDTQSANEQDKLRNNGNVNAAKTHCKHGHEFTPENTYINPKLPTERYCRACKRQRQARWAALEKDKARE